MQHSGKARRAAFNLIIWSLMLVLAIYAVGLIAKYLHALIAAIAYGPLVLWLVFGAFTLYFFRDPDPIVPTEAGVVLSPAHGTVDVIEETTEAEFMGGKCQRLSMFLSPLDVHVQKAPAAGRIALVKHTPGQFRAAMNPACGLCNENVLLGVESSERPGEKIGLRLIAGFLARRIIPWVTPGETVARGDRISIIQFGSRCDVYLPYTVNIVVKLGDKLRGGETVIARPT